MKRFMQALAVAGLISTWSMSALADGKVTLGELADLLKQLGQILDIHELANLEIQLPNGTAQSLESLAEDA